MRPHPARAPDIGEALPSIIAKKLVQTLFLFANDLELVVGGFGEPFPLAYHVCERRLEIAFIEQRRLRRLCSRSPAARRWLPGDVNERRAEQTVADDEMMESMSP